MEKHRQFFLFQVCSDHAQTSGIVRLSFPHLVLARHQVKLFPQAAFHGDDALRSENRAISFTFGQCFQDLFQFSFCVLMSSFSSPAGEDFIRMMMVMVVVVMATAAVIMVVMIVMTMIMMIMMVMMVMMVMMMTMVVMATAAVIMVVMVIVGILHQILHSCPVLQGTVD